MMRALAVLLARSSPCGDRPTSAALLSRGMGATCSPLMGVQAAHELRHEDLAMMLTVLEATVAPERAADLQAAFRNAATQVPPGLLRSHLVTATADPTRWRIETFWTSREALMAMRQAGTPAGVLMFRAAGAEPTLSVYDVALTIEAPLERLTSPSTRSEQ